MTLSFVSEYHWYTKLLMIFSGVSFLFFGISCLISEFMVLEFKRYNLANYRVLVGLLQLLGALGLGLGFYSKSWGILASIGLSILMVLGFIVRIKIKDSLLLSFPSLFYALLNLLLFILLIKFEK